MADKIYRLTFKMDDGTEKEIQFTSPQGPRGNDGNDGLCIFACDAEGLTKESSVVVGKSSIHTPSGYSLKGGDLVIGSGLIYKVSELNVPLDDSDVGVQLKYMGIDITGPEGKPGDPYTLTESDKAEIVDEVVSEIGGDGIPSYWKSALEAGAREINEKLCTAGMNKSAFLFYSDAHWNYGSQMSPRLLKYLYKHTGMTKTFFGGDIVNNEATEYEAMSYLWDWRNQLKDLPNHHSVVGNHDDGSTTNDLFFEQYVYGYLFAAEETPDVVRGGVTWYYIDNSSEKTRYIFLDTAYRGFGSDQRDFLKQALINTAEGWHIVVISHVWYNPDYEQYSVRPIPIAGMYADATSVTTMLDEYNTRSGDYADCGGWVEFCIGGHVHRDYDGTTATGIPIILVETDSQHVRGSYTYTAGTTTESSVNGIIADYDNHKIYIVRIGRGESREVTIENYAVTYTNVLPISIDTDGNIYNGKGYKENTRWSSSGNAEVASDGKYLTGYIPVKAKDIVRLKNVHLENSSSSDNGASICFKSFDDTDEASSNGNIMVQYNNAVVSEDGYISQFTVDPHAAENYKYMRIQALYIGPDSIITINEPID